MAVLVAIGGLEASESARQLADLPNLTRLRPAGAGLTALGLALSALVYLALGLWLREDRLALRLGAAVGTFAGLIGGALRAWLISVPVRDAVYQYAAVPEWFVPGALALFVGLSVVASATGGAALAFAGVRISRAWRPRPRA